MRNLVVTRQELQEGGREVLLHELAHIHHRHSWDIQLLNLVTSLQWYNPAAWLVKGELQQLHEYGADEEVIGAGVNAKEYQLLLIKKSVGHRLYSTSNYLNHSNLKNRITMMMMKKSNKWCAAKSVAALPVALLAVSLFAHPLVANGLTEISEVKVIENSPVFKTQPTTIVVEDLNNPINPKKVIWIVNDTVVNEVVAKEIPTERIASISVVKNGALNERYQLPENGGVILIDLKKGNEETSTPATPTNGQKPAAVYLKGLRDSTSIAPDQIESVRVFKKVSTKDATLLGVEEGSDVIEIVPKKE